MKQKHILLLFLYSFGLGTVIAQESPIVTGGIASGSGGSVCYSAGQVFYLTQSSTDGTITTGAQQPFEITTITSVDEGNDINLFCSAYPNPTTDFLILKVDASTTLSIHSISYLLYDMNGRLIESKMVESTETSIAMVNFVPAIYFLKVTNGNNEVKTFKIIKTQ